MENYCKLAGKDWGLVGADVGGSSIYVPESLIWSQHAPFSLKDLCQQYE